MNAGAWAAITAAMIAAVIAPWVKARIDRRGQDAEDGQRAKASLATVTEQRVERLFTEYDRLRDAYRSDIGDLRRQLGESNVRVAQLEREVAEWRAGIRGVVGVWVAVPASVMEWIRENPPPGFPDTRFPGERASDDDRPGIAGGDGAK